MGIITNLIKKNNTFFCFFNKFFVKRIKLLLMEVIPQIKGGKMKKIAILLMAVLACVSVLGFGCGKNDPSVIRLNEVTHSIFYAPLYIAINKGYFEEEDIKIELTNGGGADASMTAILSNNADIGLMGPEAAIYVKAGGAKDYAVIFGQLTKRDGSFLVAKHQDDNFNWNKTINQEIIGGRRGGVPAMTLEYVLKQKGLRPGNEINDTNNVKLNLDVAFDLTASVFIESENVEYCTLFEPTASELVAQGKGYIVASVGEDSGEVPYTAFMTKQSYLEKNPEKIEGFLRAIKKGYNYLTTAPIDDVVKAIMPSFSGSDEAIIKSSLQRYIEIDAWMSTPMMEESSYNRLQDIMESAGELPSRVPYSSLVDNTYAIKAMASMS